MEHLPPEVRAKAIAIANAVLSEQGDDATAIRIGIARAKAWARRLDIEVPDAGKQYSGHP